MPAKNILIITVDDMNVWSTCKDLYPGVVHTPNIDRLMAEGTTFRNAHVQIALCNPSRSSVWTGETPADTGVHNNAPPPWAVLNPSETLHAQLRAAGYDTVGAGKIYHTPGTSASIAAVFDHYFGDDGAEPTTSGVYTGAVEALKDVRSTTAIVDYLNAYQEENGPFFVTLGLHRPHNPWSAPQEYYDLYTGVDVQLPAYLATDLDDVPQAAINENDLRFAPESPTQWITTVRNYLAATSFSDALIGRVLDALDANGLMAHTTVLLWSDNAHHMGEKNLVYKHTLWDEATRVPLIVLDPDVGQPGQVVDHAVELLDLYPTLLDLAGLSAPARLDGESLVPLIRDPTTPWEGAAVTSEYGSFSLRTDDWRYSRYADGSEELYEMRADPHAFTNLADDTIHVATKAALAGRLDAYFSTHHIVWAAAGRNASGGSDNDTLINAISAATLTGGGGDDVYILAEGSKPTIVESAGGGLDTVYYDGTYTLPPNVERAFARDNRLPTNLTGNAQANLIAGAPFAADTLRGGEGNDTIYSYNGADLVYCGPGNDSASAGDENDTVIGLAGDDTLIGEGGNDLLRGGLGRDRLTGGEGMDTYDFDGIADSPVGTARDIITAFDAVGPAAGDQIDLSTIDANLGIAGDQPFLFIGTQPFSSAGQVRVMETGGSTLIQMNVNSVLAPDMEIQVIDGSANAADWCAGDFVL